MTVATLRLLVTGSEVASYSTAVSLYVMSPQFSIAPTSKSGMANRSECVCVGGVVSGGRWRIQEKRKGVSKSEVSSAKRGKIAVTPISGTLIILSQGKKSHLRL